VARTALTHSAAFLRAIRARDLVRRALLWL
jgi:hypothetical protein